MTPEQERAIPPLVQAYHRLKDFADSETSVTALLEATHAFALAAFQHLPGLLGLRLHPGDDLEPTLARVYLPNHEEIDLNERFIPGLVAAKIIYWCDDHQGYHLIEERRGAAKAVRRAARCNDLPAWAPGTPLDPRSF